MRDSDGQGQGNSSGDACPDELVLEEFALGRRALTAKAAHVETCGACKARIEEMRGEAAETAAVLRAARTPAEAPCGHEEALGRYLDGASSRGERKKLEMHLADCPRCLAWLVWHHRENKTLLENAGATPGVRVVDAIPKGERVEADFGVTDGQAAEAQDSEGVADEETGESSEPRKRRFL